ncbi:MAG: hypothetical protein L6Q83_00275 [Gammaproteobacteria bacterium]|nr:hypothetical protein [Gammaproteobacteria bacterium]
MARRHRPVLHYDGLTADQVYALDRLLPSDQSETPGACVEAAGTLFEVRATIGTIASGRDGITNPEQLRHLLSRPGFSQRASLWTALSARCAASKTMPHSAWRKAKLLILWVR